MKYHDLALILVLIFAQSVSALAEESGSALAANRFQQDDTSGFVLINECHHENTGYLTNISVTSLSSTT
jgi:hypothetical protein